MFSMEFARYEETTKEVQDKIIADSKLQDEAKS